LNALSTQPVSTTTANDALFDAFLRGAGRRQNDAASKVGCAEKHQTAEAAKKDATELRDNVGEFVGNVFYGTLMRQMQNSKLKGKYLHGGRGEEVFQSQLNMEYAKRMGRSPNDPIANRIYDAMTRSRPQLGGQAKAKIETSGANK
jgi:hypothetical protein